jgi:hypothetical protein
MRDASIIRMRPTNDDRGCPEVSGKAFRGDLPGLVLASRPASGVAKRLADVMEPISTVRALDSQVNPQRKGSSAKSQQTSGTIVRGQSISDRI